MVVGSCSICGERIEGRKSKLASAKANFLRNVRNHMWKKHRNTMIRRIKAGKAKAAKNPSIQDMASALSEGVRSALDIYGRWTEAQYQHMKTVMDALEPVLTPEIVISWKAIEAIHDATKG